ncbi:carbohydrate ABC transporter permease [Microbacterium nymphoidis]|jgi:multiple sugar transport system permease protein|uniref:carbohydrate ABC transporter permease n=1 Tax=Microbacterium nymphoidis TaxID=2898586 RepID=UPI001E445791|nr:sugar ABC transporter permease [Microbacterium nymphoidis]MCD2498660.1 sugar ABC transporter permease [Microbacterium nymphoidis]
MSAPTATARRGGLARTRRNEAIALAIPTVLPILILSVVPLFIGVATAFTDSRLARNHDTQFVGLKNFIDLGSDTQFWQSFGIGMIWAVTVTALQLIGGLCLALLLNTDMKFRGITRVLALIPWAMPPVVVAVMWQMIYSPTNGPLNWLIETLGGPANINWLGDFSLALPAVILVGVWVGMPQNTVVLLAGLQNVPGELQEAAAVDGASAWQRFFHVTLPALRPVIFSIASLSFIWNFNSFGIVYVMTEGGPGGRTMLPMLFTYLEAFKSRNTGSAAAMGDVIVVFLVAILTVALWRQLRSDRSES